MNATMEAQTGTEATELARIVELDARLEMSMWTAGGGVTCPTGGGPCNVNVHIQGPV